MSEAILWFTLTVLTVAARFGTSEAKQQPNSITADVTLTDTLTLGSKAFGMYFSKLPFVLTTL